MNTTNHLVSVTIPVFNGGAFLTVALESVRTQDFPKCFLKRNANNYGTNNELTP
ncbi:MAG: hypothetical protein ACYSTS_05055 [Planctomycetota bacterium]|jgi:glycosyltransferase involved in cell wall biosynthesis